MRTQFTVNIPIARVEDGGGGVLPTIAATATTGFAVVVEIGFVGVVMVFEIACPFAPTLALLFVVIGFNITCTICENLFFQIP